VELRENLAWAQHLNHQRPDAGGLPPYGADTITRFTVPRGGTVPIRDPAALALIGTPFDSFAYTADVKIAVDGAVHMNLPNLAIFLWRLSAYQLSLIRPLVKGVSNLGAPPPGLARFAVRFDLDPLDRPVRLFNTSRPGFREAEASGSLARLTEADAAPGPLLDARLTSGSEAGRPEAYIAIDFFDDAPTPPTGFDLADTGLNLFLPQSEQPVFSTTTWRFRGDNLCAWETGLRRPLADGEIAIDGRIGRLLIGVGNAAQRDALVDAAGTTARVYASFTYGAPGPVGAHPVSRTPIDGLSGLTIRHASAMPGGTSLQSQLGGLDTATQPVLVQIDDSLVHELDLSAIPGTVVDGGFALQLAQSLTIRAADGHRPIIVLRMPLAFRPVDASAATIDGPAVRFEGVLIAPAASGYPAGAPLVSRAAVTSLAFVGCTLFPGGHSLRNGTRAPMQPAMDLRKGYGFTVAADEAAFVPTPHVVLQRCITGALAIDERYRLDLQDCIVDADTGLAIGNPTDPANGWSCALDFSGITVFGSVRTAAVGGSGGIFTQPFAVLDNQHGCLKFCSFSEGANRLPANHFCVRAPDAVQRFTSVRFNAPGYGQLAFGADLRIRTVGPGDDAMGAFGFLLEAHKWINLNTRLAEFMPIGIRPLTVPVT